MMRVLLDENLPRRLKRHLGEGVEGVTVQERGWAGTQNGTLLRQAEAEFDAFLTMDRGIRYQQNISTFALAIVLLDAPGNRFQDLCPLVPDLQALLPTVQPGKLYEVKLPLQPPVGE